MEGWQSQPQGSSWNPQGYGSLMDQSGMDYDEQGAWDELVDDMDQQYKDRSQGAYKQHKNKTWRMTAAQANPYNSKNAMDVAYRFFEALDLQNTTEEQDEILLNSIKYGTTSAGCMGGEETTPGYHWHEIQALEHIEADEGWKEELILDVMHNGLIGYSTFLSNPPRGKIYKKLNKLLDEHDEFVPSYEGEISEFETLTDGLIEIWIDQISNMDFKSLVCYSDSGGVLQRRSIGQVFGITKGEKRVYNRGDDRSTAVSFGRLWSDRDKDEQPQAVIDQWLQMIPIIDDDMMRALGEMDYDGGGRKRSKKTMKRRKSLPYAMTNQFERLY